MLHIVEQAIAENLTSEGALLPILHGVQARLGYIPAEGLLLIAERLNLSQAEVYGVVSFYQDFRDAPIGKNLVKICCAEACQARGSRSLERHATEVLALDYGSTSSDGGITLEKVYCLGNCACGPSVSIGDRVFANVDAARFDRLIADLGTEAAP
ncbi:MAG: NAD(P)H-dependent oxidoreductase subunit E [Porticoccaceae bacterium]